MYATIENLQLFLLYPYLKTSASVAKLRREIKAHVTHKHSSEPRC